LRPKGGIESRPAEINIRVKRLPYCAVRTAVGKTIQRLRKETPIFQTWEGKKDEKKRPPTTKREERIYVGEKGELQSDKQRY